MNRAATKVAGAAVLALGLLFAGLDPATAYGAALSASLVNTIDTSGWALPSPDPSGLAYDAAANRLIVVDGEVEEMAIYAGANYYEAALTGGLQRTANTLRFTPEPVGAAFTPGRVFISDDDADRIYQVALGADGRFDTADPVSSFSTSPYSSGDPEGLAYDAAGGRIFIADGVGSEIHQVTAMDGVFGNGNDQSQHFDTAGLGIEDAEAVEWVPERGTLFTIGDDGSRVVELPPTGALVSEIDTSFLPLDRPAGLAWAPRSIDPTRRSLYIADRKVDNDSAPSENDGAIYELGIDPDSGSPRVDVRVRAGADDAEESIATGAVNLTNGDLEMVTDRNTQQVVGLRFGAAAIPAGATITQAWIQFTADEAQSDATSLTLRGQASDNAAAFTTATRNVSSRPRTAAAISWSPPAWTTGTAQRTPDLSAVVQEVVSRPGWASGNALAFVVTGTGHRTAESFEGGSARAALLHVEYSTDATNRAPVVNAGPDQSITLPASAALDGTVSDDGRPDPTPTVAWSTVSGPGTVTFSAPTSPDTQASFSTAGTYVLRLTADDGELTASDDVTVEVRAAGSAALDVRVTAGAHDAEEATSGSVSLTSSDLELVADGSVQQTVGIRFSTVAIPAGAEIRAAWIQFSADEAQSEATSLTVQAQASDSAAAYTTAAHNVSSRPRTAAAASWSPPAWTSGAVGAAQRTPDLSALVQEVVARPGWASGNALAFVIAGTGHRTADSFEGGATVAPLLHVEYTSPA